MPKSTGRLQHFPRLIKAQQRRCYLCGELLPPQDGSWCGLDKIATLDHIRPKADGGTRLPPNAAIAHNKCNGLKGDRPPFPCEVLFGQVMAEVIGFTDTGTEYWEPEAKPAHWKTRNPEFESALAVALREAGLADQ